MECARGARREEASTLGLPVVPLVYMMVHRSWGLGGMGSAGCFLPSPMKSSQVYTFSPAFSSMSCAQPGSGSRCRTRSALRLALQGYQLSGLIGPGIVESVTVTVPSTL